MQAIFFRCRKRCVRQPPRQAVFRQGKAHKTQKCCMLFRPSLLLLIARYRGLHFALRARNHCPEVLDQQRPILR